LTTALFTIKVVYDHTRIASYRRWGVRSAWLLRIRLLALGGRSAKLAGGLSSDPILSGLRRTVMHTIAITVTGWYFLTISVVTGREFPAVSVVTVRDFTAFSVL
jgi:hypothetical protein